MFRIATLDMHHNNSKKGDNNTRDPRDAKKNNNSAKAARQHCQINDCSGQQQHCQATRTLQYTHTHTLIITHSQIEKTNACISPILKQSLKLNFVSSYTIYGIFTILLAICSCIFLCRAGLTFHNRAVVVSGKRKLPNCFSEGGTVEASTH